MRAVNLQGQGRDYLRGSSQMAHVPALPSSTGEFRTELHTPSWVVMENFSSDSVESRTARNASQVGLYALASLSAGAGATLLSILHLVSCAQHATSSFITSRPVPRAMSMKCGVAPPLYGASRTHFVSSQWDSFVVFSLA